MMPCRTRVFVVEPPEPIVTPADMPGDHAADDATVAAYIAAATAEIDGPAGWLRRAIGPQTLELRINDFGWGRIKLPFPEIIEIVSLKYLDDDEAEQTVSPVDYALAGQLFYSKPSFATPSVGPDYEGVRLRYRAGYDGALNGSPAGTTGPVPEPIKQWVILRVSQLIAAADADLLIKSETTNDIDSHTNAMPADILAGGDPLAMALLSPYIVYD